MGEFIVDGEVRPSDSEEDDGDDDDYQDVRWRRRWR